MSTGRRDGFSAETGLAQGMARRLREWALAAGASDAAAGAAGRVGEELVRALAQGHVCTVLEPETAAALLASRVATTPGDGGAPLVIDAGHRLYFARYFDYEQRLACSLASRAAGAPSLPAESVVRARVLLDRLFAASAQSPDWQRLAAAMGLAGRLTIISGGPGTGKTSTVVRILACLLNEEPQSRIALAAPTGKAAARMHEAVQAAAERENLDAAIRAGLPARALTLHRLLAYSPQRGFAHHAGHPLPVDVLVIDEASMLDLALATRVCEALPAQARLILLGDKDQLAAVEAGAIFAELAADATLSPSRRQLLSSLTGIPEATMDTAPPHHSSPLAGQVVWLTRTYRFAADSGIHRLALAVRDGDADGALGVLGDAPVAGDLEYLPMMGSAAHPALIRRLLAGYAAYLDALPADSSDTFDAGAIFSAFNHFRILCATRVGTRGIETLNALLTEAVRARLQGNGAASGDWFIGRPIMVQRNDHGQQLFNGDVGIVLPASDAEGQLSVYFQDGEQGWRVVPPARLPEHDTAFATTVHKAQGSEFDVVALVLPPGSESPVVTRELVYTGVTRARVKVIVCAEAVTLRAGILRRLERRSGLLSRLQEACAEEQLSQSAPR
jgi:exodeoxyribonuclease V alpha subunit